MSEVTPEVEAHAEVMARTVSESVMASQSAHDVVIPARSAGEHSPADDHASITHQLQAAGTTEKSNPLSKAPFDVDHSQSSHPDSVAGHSVNGVPSDRVDGTSTLSVCTHPAGLQRLPGLTSCSLRKIRTRSQQVMIMSAERRLHRSMARGWRRLTLKTPLPYRTLPMSVAARTRRVDRTRIRRTYEGTRATRVILDRTR